MTGPPPALAPVDDKKGTAGAPERPNRGAVAERRGLPGRVGGGEAVETVKGRAGSEDNERGGFEPVGGERVERCMGPEEEDGGIPVLELMVIEPDDELGGVLFWKTSHFEVF